MEPSEHASRTLASGAAEVAKRVAEEEIITHTVGLAGC